MASRRANKLYNMMLKYRDETAIKKLKKAKKTDTDEQVVLKSLHNRNVIDMARADVKKDKDLLLTYDTDAMRARTFMSQRRPRQERESLWKLIKGKMKAKGSA